MIGGYLTLVGWLMCAIGSAVIGVAPVDHRASRDHREVGALFLLGGLLVMAAGIARHYLDGAD